MAGIWDLRFAAVPDKIDALEEDVHVESGKKTAQKNAETQIP
jgi:hypothetical protein